MDKYKEKVLEHAIANVLTNAANYPKDLRPRVLGQNLSGLTAKVKEGVVNTGLYIIDDEYMLAHEKVTRVELITGGERHYVGYGVGDVITALQDGGRTLKLFLKEN